VLKDLASASGLRLLHQLETGAILACEDDGAVPRRLQFALPSPTLVLVLAAGAGSLAETEVTGPLPVRAGDPPVLFHSGVELRLTLQGPCRLLLVMPAVAGLGALLPGAAADAVLNAALKNLALRALLGAASPEAMARILGQIGQRLSVLAARPRGDALPAWRLRRLERFLAEHLAEPITLADMARAVGLSHFHFARCLKLTLGETPREHLLRRRVERACSLMAGGDAALASVAQAAGFRTQAHFSNVFRRFTGVSPRDWRRRQPGRGMAPASAAE